MSGGDHRAKATDKWARARSANLGLGRPLVLCGRWAPPFVSRLLVSSRIFLNWCHGKLWILTQHVGPSCSLPHNPLRNTDSPKLMEFYQYKPYSYVWCWFMSISMFSCWFILVVIDHQSLSIGKAHVFCLVSLKFVSLTIRYSVSSFGMCNKVL
jgi:hypothetical protein